MSSQALPVARHTPVEDILGIATGAFVASLGLLLLKAGGVVTGGTAGLGLLLGHVTPWPFAAVYVTVSLPFVLLAITRKGWNFTIRSVIAVSLVSVFSLVHPAGFVVEHITPVYAALVGNLMAGIGILILFRHNSSLGGFNIVALICQERLGWRAGYVQMGLDAVVILLSALAVPAHTVLLSGAGAVVFNLILAVNHRPGRYLAS